MGCNVFVLMPFRRALQTIYDTLVKEPLEEAGHTVTRADELKTQRNILHDIVKAISESNIVVADLTDTNANVLYELGWAHALGKPVIMITQAVEDLPFDVAGYRVLRYSNDFAGGRRFRRELVERVSGICEGTLEWSGPLKDFLERPLDAVGDDAAGGKEASLDLERPGAEPGLLDNLGTLAEFTDYGIASIDEMTKVMGRLRPRTEQYTEQLRTASLIEGTGRISRARKVTREYVTDLRGFTQEIEQERQKYIALLEPAENVLEALGEWQVKHLDGLTSDELDELRDSRVAWEGAARAAEGALSGMSTMRETVDGLVEHNFDASLSNALVALSDVLLRVSEMFSRSVNMFRRGVTALDGIGEANEAG